MRIFDRILVGVDDLGLLQRRLNPGVAGLERR
jgi:hypothetical protein